MLQQEKEFAAWGLSRVAIRNIVVFFIIAELLAIGALSKIVLEQQKLRDQDKHELIKAKDEAALKIEQLKNEQIQSMQNLEAITDQQRDLDNKIRDLSVKVQRVKKR